MRWRHRSVKKMYSNLQSDSATFTSLCNSSPLFSSSLLFYFLFASSVSIHETRILGKLLVMGECSDLDSATLALLPTVQY